MAPDLSGAIVAFRGKSLAAAKRKRHQSVEIIRVHEPHDPSWQQDAMSLPSCIGRPMEKPSKPDAFGDTWS